MMGVINFATNGFSLPTSVSGHVYKFIQNDTYTNAIELNNGAGSGIVFDGSNLKSNQSGYYTNFIRGASSTTLTDKDIIKGLLYFGFKDLEAMLLVSTNDNGDETFATDVPPKFIFIQEINTDTKLKISAIDYDNKTFTISRSDGSGEEITFHAFVIN